MAESLAVVEGYADIVGLFLDHHLVEGVAKAHDSRRIQPFAVDARRANQRIIGAVDDRVGIQKNQFWHDEDDFFECKITNFL